MGREWIEITYSGTWNVRFERLPPWGGSGLKFFCCKRKNRNIGLPPWGGSGLKSLFSIRRHLKHGSPSLGREWIEMETPNMIDETNVSPSLGREWIEIPWKCSKKSRRSASPSLGREWIEIIVVRFFRQSPIGLPPWGGSGLKSSCLRYCFIF